MVAVLGSALVALPAQGRSVTTVASGGGLGGGPGIPDICVGDPYFCSLGVGLGPQLFGPCERVIQGATDCYDFMAVPDTLEKALRVQTAWKYSEQPGGFFTRAQVGDSLVSLGTATQEQSRAENFLWLWQSGELVFDIREFNGPLIMSLTGTTCGGSGCGEGTAFFLYDNLRDFALGSRIVMSSEYAGQWRQVTVYQGVPEPESIALALGALAAAVGVTMFARRRQRQR